jgi:hypothetical protein
MELEQLAYEAYRAHTGGISLASGQPIPEWSQLKPEIQDAWDSSTAAVITAIANERCMCDAHTVDYPSPCVMCQVQMDQLSEEVRAVVASYLDSIGRGK